ncbi:acetylcholine receptor subunit beta-like [Octopus sinensis]|uniref:Acetylcholine receptor subunit beta-like n=1 Tax=Octopus sinensis TaxID=2607531 RepID=A0A7E6FQB6_9MOLL|nr:acetylcholine receptor subunit beta-like [Octopus sinensis]
MILHTKIFLIAVFWTVLTPQQIGSKTPGPLTHFQRIKALLTYVKSGSSPLIRPSSLNTTIDIHIEIQMMDSIELQEQEQTMECSGILTLTWKDDGITWDPAQYDGVDRLTLPAPEIWTPRLVLANSAVEPHEIDFDIVDITNSGTITATIYRSFTTLCTLNMLHFPFDEQTCPIIIKSSISAQNMNLVYASSESKLKVLYEDSRRSWFNIVISEHKCNRTGTNRSIMFLVSAKRKPIYHVFSSLIPCSLLVFIASLSFFSPPESGEQISLSITNFLAFVTYFMAFSQNFPKNMDLKTVPIFYYLLSYSLVMTSVSVFSAILMSIARYKNKHECRMLFGCYRDLLTVYPEKEEGTRRDEIHRRRMYARMKLFNSMLFLLFMIGALFLVIKVFEEFLDKFPSTNIPNICTESA